MSSASTLPREERVLLLGSVRLKNVEDVMETASRLLGPCLSRIPDGEISIEPWGERRGFVSQLRPVASESPYLEPDPEEEKLGRRLTLETESHRGTRPPRFRVAAGIDPASVRFETTGLARTALDSYVIFRRLKEGGAIDERMRFQVCLPTVAAFLNTHIVLDAQDAVARPYREALISDIERIVQAIPAAELTIQWDISTEVAQWEGVRQSTFADVKAGVIDLLSVQCEAVPREVELGLHLCYGNFGLKHWREPESLANCCAIYNRLAETVARPIEYVHMPVPIDRDDDPYFTPLDDLALRPETRLYLGLVHEQDGVEGALRRIATARAHAARFGISTECGFGERKPEIVPELMRLHAEIADRALE